MVTPKRRCVGTGVETSPQEKAVMWDRTALKGARSAELSRIELRVQNSNRGARRGAYQSQAISNRAVKMPGVRRGNYSLKEPPPPAG